VRINAGRSVRVDGIETFGKAIEQATTGENIGVLFCGLDKSELSAGDVI
jgi:elongation factor Tu